MGEAGLYELFVLAELMTGEKHGYVLQDILKNSVGLGRKISSGTLYPLLMRMTDQGLLEAEWREPLRPGRPARHAYRLTATGVELARAAAGAGKVSSWKVSLT